MCQIVLWYPLFFVVAIFLDACHDIGVREAKRETQKALEKSGRRELTCWANGMP